MLSTRDLQFTVLHLTQSTLGLASDRRSLALQDTKLIRISSSSSMESTWPGSGLAFLSTIAVNSKETICQRTSRDIIVMVGIYPIKRRKDEERMIENASDQSNSSFGGQVDQMLGQVGMPFHCFDVLW